MKIKKSDLIEAKFVVPKDQVKDFDYDMEKEYDEEDTVHVVDENKFVVPQDGVKDFEREMGSDLEDDDTVQVADEDEPMKVNPVITKEGLIRVIKEGLRKTK